MRIERVVARAAALARAGHDVATYAASLVAELGTAVPHAAACVLTLDPATGLLTGSYKYGGLDGAHAQDGDWAQLEYASDDPSRLVVVGRRPLPALSTSQLPGGVHASVRMRELVLPAGYGDELRMVARDGNVPWGAVNLFRASDDPPFDPDEVALLAELSTVIAAGLRAASVVRDAGRGADVPDGPATLVIREGADHRELSPGAAALLDDLTDQRHRSPALSVIEGLVVAARRYATGASSRLPRVRLRTRSGGWLVAHAAPLATGDDRAGAVVVTIDQARPAEIVELVAASAGLTPRERQVAELVLAGHDTRTIARQLSVSSHTVQDHLKAIFDKTDVRSRRELVARVFFEQYAPRLSAGVSATPQPAHLPPR